jgi:hypothetical protein
VYARSRYNIHHVAKKRQAKVRIHPDNYEVKCQGLAVVRAAERTAYTFSLLDEQAATPLLIFVLYVADCSIDREQIV